MFDSELDPTVWILGKNNEHVPSISFAPESAMSRIVYYIFYCLLQ